MNQWRIPLEGDKDSIDRLIPYAGAVGWKIVEENGRPYAQFSESEVGETEAGARARANSNLKYLFNHVASRTALGLQSLQLGDSTVHLQPNGNRGVWVHVGTAIAVVEGSVVVASDGTSPTPEPPLTLAELVDYFELDGEVQEILQLLFRRDNRPMNLWKVFELISKDLPCKQWIANGWTTDEDWLKFKASVNEPDVMGEGARHAIKRHQDREEFFDENSAFLYLKGIVHKWLLWKKENYSNL